VNKREQAILIEVYAGLNEMTGLDPINPMDVRAVSANLKTCTRAARDLMFALFHLRTGEYEEAEACAAEARTTLKAGKAGVA